MKKIILFGNKRNPYGEELVTNGSFDTDTDWVKGNSWTIGGGTANYDAVLSGTATYQSITLEAGKQYNIKFSPY